MQGNHYNPNSCYCSCASQVQHAVSAVTREFSRSTSRLEQLQGFVIFLIPSCLSVCPPKVTLSIITSTPSGEHWRESSI